MTYYHVLAGGIPFWESRIVLKESLRTLELILKLGDIYCRGDLKAMEIDIYDKTNDNWNGEEYISVCIDDPSDTEFFGENFGLDSSFFRYAKLKIAIEFKPTIIDNCSFRNEPYRKLPGERQIYKFIDISNISRIIIGIDGELQKTAIQVISKLCEPYNIPVMTFKQAEKSSKKDKVLEKLLTQEKL